MQTGDPVIPGWITSRRCPQVEHGMLGPAEYLADGGTGECREQLRPSHAPEDIGVRETGVHHPAAQQGVPDVADHGFDFGEFGHAGKGRRVPRCGATVSRVPARRGRLVRGSQPAGGAGLRGAQGAGQLPAHRVPRHQLQTAQLLGGAP